jgi:ribonuclease HI
MEVMAVVVGLREIPAPARVRIHIDSSYVLYTFTQGRRERWQGNGWRTAARKPVKTAICGSSCSPRLTVTTRWNG